MADRQSIDTEKTDSRHGAEKDCEEFVCDLLSDEVAVTEEYEEILADCDKQGMSERDLWQSMALYLQKGVVKEQGSYPPGISDWYGEKLRKRIITLIGKLPSESLEEFRGLVAFTASFLTRVEFVCDLIVYLFAEREKGWEREETDKSEYIQFFTEKLMWELEVITRVAEGTPLESVNGEYVDWLMDRILDGEVMA